MKWTSRDKLILRGSETLSSETPRSRRSRAGGSSSGSTFLILSSRWELTHKITLFANLKRYWSLIIYPWSCLIHLYLGIASPPFCLLPMPIVLLVLMIDNCSPKISISQHFHPPRCPRGPDSDNFGPTFSAALNWNLSSGLNWSWES